MRKDIEFDAAGVTLRGWLYLPQGAPKPVPDVVMAHGFSAVKEQHLDRFAAVFAEAGLAALVFDNRNFGASGGEPRQEIDPLSQLRDYRHAVTFARTLPEVDRERIGAWGTSLSGGHVLVLGATDERVKCVVAQAPATGASVDASHRARPDSAPADRVRPAPDREAHTTREPPETIPVVSEDASARAALPGLEAWEFFEGTRRFAPAWRNEVTSRSVDMARAYEPGAYVSRIGPVPLLMIVATRDTLVPADLALAAYERALEPKKLVLLSGGHFAPYLEAFDQASAAARDWFVDHLSGR